jgi:hypothetical protein
MQDRVYQRKRKLVEKFIKKHGKIDHYIILNNVNVDYDTLMKILQFPTTLGIDFSGIVKQIRKDDEMSSDFKLICFELS